MLNTSDFCERTHTRIDRYKSRTEKSILDYIFVSSDLKKNVISMCIDEQKQFTSWCILKSGKRFSDHCAIKFQLDSRVLSRRNSPKVAKCGILMTQKAGRSSINSLIPKTCLRVCGEQVNTLNLTTSLGNVI